MAGAIGFENFASGIGGVTVVAYLSALCNLRFTATQYALLSALASIAGRFLTGTTAGALIEAMGYVNFYLLTTLIALPGVVLYWLHGAFGTGRRVDGDRRHRPRVAPAVTSSAVDDPAAEPLQPPGIELHSIDYVPASERHGTVRHLGALWFVSDINLTGLATGVTTSAAGAGLVWTLVATVCGALFGTFFMAFHSAQGPQLGLPQLVQSRPQFGYLGAAVTVWVFAFINYVAYNTSDAILSGDALQALAGLPPDIGYFLSASVAAVVALFGYHWIHRINRWLTWPLIV